MADAPEGWWKASDGRWYPPEQLPGPPVAPPPVAPPVGPPQYPTHIGAPQYLASGSRGYAPATGPEPTVYDGTWWALTVAAISSLLCCGPLGIVVVWFTRWPKNVKIGVTAAIGVCWIIYFAVLIGASGSRSTNGLIGGL